MRTIIPPGNADIVRRTGIAFKIHKLNSAKTMLEELLVLLKGVIITTNLQSALEQVKSELARHNDEMNGGTK